MSEFTRRQSASDADSSLDIRTAGSSSAFALQRLDRLLARAVAIAKARYDRDDSPNPFRGLYVSSEQAERALDGSAGEPLSGVIDTDRPDDWARILEESPSWEWLRASYGLNAYELDLVLIALGPEVDLRYERVYGFIQDDVSRRRPTIELALNMISASAGEKLILRALIEPTAPLVSHRIIKVISDPNTIAPTLLGHYLKLDEQIVDVLLQQNGLDRRLSQACSLNVPHRSVADSSLGEETFAALRSLVLHVRPLRLYFHGYSNWLQSYEIVRFRADMVKVPNRWCRDRACSCSVSRSLLN